MFIQIATDAIFCIAILGGVSIARKKLLKRAKKESIFLSEKIDLKKEDEDDDYDIESMIKLGFAYLRPKNFTQEDESFFQKLLCDLMSIKGRDNFNGRVRYLHFNVRCFTFETSSLKRTVYEFTINNEKHRFFSNQIEKIEKLILVN